MSLPSIIWKQLTWSPPAPPQSLDLSQQTALITGADGGLGLQCAHDLARCHAHRLILCSRKDDDDLKRQIRHGIAAINPACEVDFWTVDYENYQDLLECGKKASTLDRLDIVILNAGVQHVAFHRSSVTAHEMNVQVNHIGTSLLSLVLYPALQDTAKRHSKASRLSIVSSATHYWASCSEFKSLSLFADMDADNSMRNQPHMDRYYATKLMNVLWMRKLAEQIDQTHVIVNAVDPGLCHSNLHRHQTSPMVKMIVFLIAWKVTQGAHNIVNAAIVQKADSHGQYISNQEIKLPSRYVLSTEGHGTQSRLWTQTVDLLKEEAVGFTVPQLE